MPDPNDAPRTKAEVLEMLVDDRIEAGIEAYLKRHVFKRLAVADKELEVLGEPHSFFSQNMEDRYTRARDAVKTAVALFPEWVREYDAQRGDDDA